MKTDLEQAILGYERAALIAGSAALFKYVGIAVDELQVTIVVAIAAIHF